MQTRVAGLLHVCVNTHVCIQQTRIACVLYICVCVCMLIYLHAMQTRTCCICVYLYVIHFVDLLYTYVCIHMANTHCRSVAYMRMY